MYLGNIASLIRQKCEHAHDLNCQSISEPVLN